MKFDKKIKKLPKSEVEITITIEESSMVKHRDQALLTLGKNVQIKGFRPGKVPLEKLKESVNPEAVEGVAIETAMNEAYKILIETEKLMVASKPKVTLNSENPVSFTAITAVVPVVKLKNHSKIKVSPKPKKITDKEVKESIDGLLKSRGEWKDVDSKVKDGNRVEIDFQGYFGSKVEDGKEAPNTKSVNHPLIIGSKTFIPGFEDEVLGMKIGETKDFTLTFPKDYHQDDFKGKKVTFRCTVKRIEEQILPKFDDKFVDEFTKGDKKTVKEFEKYVREVLEEKEVANARKESENELISKWLELAEFDVSDLMLEAEADAILADYRKNIESRGLEFEKHLEMIKKSMEVLKKEALEEARKRVMLRLILDHIIKEDKIEVTEKEISDEIEKVIKRYPESEAPKIRAHYDNKDELFKMRQILIVAKVFENYIK